METITYTLPIETAGSLLPLPIPLPGRTVIQLTLPVGPLPTDVIVRILTVEVGSWKRSG